MKKILILCLVITLNSCNSKKNNENGLTEQNVPSEIINTNISGTYYSRNSSNNNDRRDYLVISELENDTYLLKIPNRRITLTGKRSGNVLTGQILLCAFTIEFINEYKTANISACKDNLTYEKD